VLEQGQARPRARRVRSFVAFTMSPFLHPAGIVSHVLPSAPRLASGSGYAIAPSQPRHSDREKGESVMSTIGIVGLGLLGHAIASRLIKAGHAVIGFDVLPDRVAALAVMGGTPLPPQPPSLSLPRPSARSCLSRHRGGGHPRGRRRPRGARPTSRHPDEHHLPTLTERLSREVTARGLGFLDCPSAARAAWSSGRWHLLRGGIARSSSAGSPCSSRSSRAPSSWAGGSGHGAQLVPICSCRR